MTGDRLRIAIPADAGYGYYFETLTALGAEPVPVGGDVDPAAFDGLLTPGGTDRGLSQARQPRLFCRALQGNGRAAPYRAARSTPSL